MNFYRKELQEELASIGNAKIIKAGEEILRENSFVAALPLLKSGLLGVYRTDEDGKEMLVYYVKPDESCIMSFLAGIHHDTSKVKAVAEEDSEIVFIPIAKVSEWIGKYPEWLEYIFKIYHRRFEELLNVLNSIAFQKMDARLLRHLVKKSDAAQTEELAITHQQIANELGSTREVISRLLKQMEKEELIALSRNKIVLLPAAKKTAS